MQSARPGGSDRMIENRTFDEIASRRQRQPVPHRDAAGYRALRRHLGGRQSGPYGSRLCRCGYVPQDHRARHAGGRVDLGGPGHRIARARHDLSRAGSALPSSGEHRRPDHRDIDGDGKASRESETWLLDCRCTNQNGELVISGTAYVRAPTEKVRRPARRTAGGAAQPSRAVPGAAGRHGRARTVGHGGGPSLRRQCAGRGRRGGSGWTHHADPGRTESEDPQGGRGGEGRHRGISAG